MKKLRFIYHSIIVSRKMILGGEKVLQSGIM